MPRRTIVLAGLLVLVGVAVGWAVLAQRQGATGGTIPASVEQRHPDEAQRPPLTPAEEAFANALWPLHREVETGGLRLGLAGIYFKAGDIDREDFRGRVGAALMVFQADEPRVRDLQPPPSMQKLHVEYVQGVQLYQQAANELLQVDSRDDPRLVSAATTNQAASNAVREVGRVLWPTQYTPH